MRRFIALTLALTLLSSGVTGCSQPIDTGSTVPAQTQPIVALLALVGLGIGLTAWHHHNEHSAANGGGGPAIFPAVLAVPPFIAGYKPIDLAIDVPNFNVAALEVPTTGGGTGKLTEITSAGGAFNTYTLPAAYVPVAVAMDQSGTTWFDDATGRVRECAPMTSSTTTCTSATGPFIDGLGAGSRSISADANFVVVVIDAGNGKVKWWAEAISSSPQVSATGTYSSNSSAAIFAADSIESTQSGGISDFTVYHQDGSSDNVTFSFSGSTFTINAQPNMSFNPLPLVAVSNFGADGSKFAFFSFTGSPAASYSLTKYDSSSLVSVIAPSAISELIEFNGQIGDPAHPFTAPLFSAHFDSNNALLWAIDAGNNVIGFGFF